MFGVTFNLSFVAKVVILALPFVLNRCLANDHDFFPTSKRHIKIYTKKKAKEPATTKSFRCGLNITNTLTDVSAAIPLAPYIAFFEDFTMVKWSENVFIVQDKNGRKWNGFSCRRLGGFECIAEVVAARIYGALLGAETVASEASFVVDPEDNTLVSPIIPYEEPYPIFNPHHCSIYGNMRPKHLEETVALWRFLGMPNEAYATNARNQLLGHHYIRAFKEFNYDQPFYDEEPRKNFTFCLSHTFYSTITEYTCDTQKIQELVCRARSDSRVNVIINEIEAALDTHHINSDEMSLSFKRIREFFHQQQKYI